jgi:DHA2 family multidrug resistance protein
LTEIAASSSPHYQSTLDQLQSVGMSPLQAAAAVMQQIVTQSYLLASLEVFRLSAWLVLAMIPVVWLCRRPAPNGHIVLAD